MTDAKTLLLELLAVIPNGDKVAALFAEEGVVELPFLHAVGMPARHQGRARIKDFYDQVGKLYADFGFKPHRTPHPSSVRGTTRCGKGTNQAAAGIAERRRRGASAEPERRGRPPSPACRDFLRSLRLRQLGEGNDNDRAPQRCAFEMGLVRDVRNFPRSRPTRLPAKSDGSFRQSPPRSSTASGTRFSSTPS